MIELTYAELHAFPDGDQPHTGNPAGVVLLDRALEDSDLLGVARSNNLSETAFLTPPEGEGAWGLRWFTPAVEVDLCGHATLAAAAFLFEKGRVKNSVLHFETRSGALRVRREAAGRYAMDFPAIRFRPADEAFDAIAALGAGEPEAVFEIDRVHGARYQMLVYKEEAAIAALRPDMGALKAAGINLIATAPGDKSDYVSRFFAPASGVDEDPVTGSAHCTLAPYWSKRLGRADLSARQIGPRPGALETSYQGGDRVMLLGGARRYLDGVIRL
jgi:PhzF family phenazine biosynthesis protein